MTVATVTIRADGSSASVPITITPPASPACQFTRIDYSGQTTPADVAQRGYRNLVLEYRGPGTKSYIASLKAAAPGVRCFAYQGWAAKPIDPAGNTMMSAWTGSAYPGGLPTNWFLLDMNGQPQFSTAYGGMYFMDFGLPAYQTAALQHAIGIAKAGGFDGIFFDGIDTVLGIGALKAGLSQTNLNNTNYLAAMTSFLTYAGPQLHASGLLGISNIGASYQSDAQAALWAKWSGLLDGALEEFWAVDFNGNPMSATQATRQLGNAAWSEANGKLCLLNQDVRTQALNVYGVGLMLLTAGSESFWNVSDGNYSGGETWWPEYAAALALGQPLGPYSVAGSVFTRRFAGGTVTVDVSQHTASIT